MSASLPTQRYYVLIPFQFDLSLIFHTRIFSHSRRRRFYSVTLPPQMPSVLAPLVHTEQRKSSNKMPHQSYLIAGTLTFSFSYLMVVFIYQTNVRNTIPQAQSLWCVSQLFLLPLSLTSPLDCEQQSSKGDICNTAAVSQTASCLSPEGESTMNWD